MRDHGVNKIQGIASSPVTVCARIAEFGGHGTCSSREAGKAATKPTTAHGASATIEPPSPRQGR